MVMRRARALLEPTFLLAFAAACSGGAGEDPRAGASGSAGAAPTGATGGTTGVSGGSGKGGSAGTSGAGAAGASGMPSTSDCPTVDVARTPLRRLTRFEYANTVRELLHVDSALARDLPADEVTNGFDNNAGVLTVSALHAEKYVLVSEALAKTAVQNLAALTICDPATTGEEACARDFAQRFGRRAFRRPITTVDEQALMTAYAAGRTGGTHAEGIEVMIRAALQSPDFLYRLEMPSANEAGQRVVPLTQYELATRLSYLVWASGPDDALLDAAANGALGTKEQVGAKAREMLADPKARISIANFFGQWTSTNRLEITTKNTMLFPAFTTELRDAMARELPAFLNDVLFSGDHSLGTLLTSPVAFVSGPLAALYGVSAPSGSETMPMRVALPANQDRAGILTQAGFLSVQGHPDQTSPVLRGKFVRAMMLCQPPQPPPDDVNISVPEVDPNATARERFGAHLSAGDSCYGCHVAMDPIGLAFEHFDAMGRFREMDGGKAIDVSGEIFDATDPSLAGPFQGVRELAEKLAGSVQVRNCLATQWFRFASGRQEANVDSCSLGTLQSAFDASSGDLIELVVSMTQTDSFMNRAPVTP
jgi:uncharacterized protein DUF1592/uncharacterized protein DUF1588/uncharacterized protein DUF1587/uncharacterized protein DUF1595/uncharacterized protein DUF1585